MIKNVDDIELREAIWMKGWITAGFDTEVGDVFHNQVEISVDYLDKKVITYGDWKVVFLKKVGLYEYTVLHVLTATEAKRILKLVEM